MIPSSLFRDSCHSGFSDLAEEVEIRSCRNSGDLFRVSMCSRTASLESSNDTSDGIFGYSYATTVNNAQPCLPYKMVTHSWRNRVPCLQFFGSNLLSSSHSVLVILFSMKPRPATCLLRSSPMP